LHHGHVFVGGRVVDDRRPETFHGLVHIPGAGNISQLGEEAEAGKLFIQFSVEWEQRGFGLIKTDQRKGIESGYLATDLRADRTRRAGYHDGFPPRRSRSSLSARSPG